MDVKPSNEDLVDVAFQIKAAETIGKNWEVQFVRVGSIWVVYSNTIALATAVISRDPKGAFRATAIASAGTYAQLTALKKILLFHSSDSGIAYKQLERPPECSVATIDNDRGPELLYFPNIAGMTPARDGWLRRSTIEEDKS